MRPDGRSRVREVRGTVNKEILMVVDAVCDVATSHRWVGAGADPGLMPDQEDGRLAGARPSDQAAPVALEQGLGPGLAPQPVPR